MELRKTLGQDKGLTLVEILIAVGIAAIIISLGLLLSMDFYRTYAFNYEKELIISLLQQARSRSMANTGQLTHGVGYNSVNGEYDILEDRAVAQSIDANSSISVTGWPGSGIVFNQLEGACPDCGSGIGTTITLSGLSRTVQIMVNKDGRIDYD